MITRFAPSPTGPLHLGHAYSALLAHDMAMKAGGTFVLRIEDIDQSRARATWETQIYEDLAWLGLSWSTPVLRQSDRLITYETALNTLWAQGDLFACTCNRRDIESAASAPQEGTTPRFGPDGIIYPGTCRPTTESTRGQVLPRNTALRLHMAKAARSDTPLNFTETGAGPQGEHGTIPITDTDLVHNIGDVVLARRDMGTSYHLSAVLDDAAQGVTHVVRGMDLFDATKIHVALQNMLNLPTPIYHHHRLIRDDRGKRLAKRDDARAISTYRADGLSPQDIRSMVGL